MDLDDFEISQESSLFLVKSSQAESQSQLDERNILQNLPALKEKPVDAMDMNQNATKLRLMELSSETEDDGKIAGNVLVTDTECESNKKTTTDDEPELNPETLSEGEGDEDNEDPRDSKSGTSSDQNEVTVIKTNVSKESRGAAPGNEGEDETQEAETSRRAKSSSTTSSRQDLFHTLGEVVDSSDEEVSTPSHHFGSLQLSGQAMLVPETVDSVMEDEELSPWGGNYGLMPTIIPSSPTMEDAPQGDEESDDLVLHFTPSQTESFVPQGSSQDSGHRHLGSASEQGSQQQNGQSAVSGHSPSVPDLAGSQHLDGQSAVSGHSPTVPDLAGSRHLDSQSAISGHSPSVPDLAGSQHQSQTSSVPESQISQLPNLPAEASVPAPSSQSGCGDDREEMVPELPGTASSDGILGAQRHRPETESEEQHQEKTTPALSTASLESPQQLPEISVRLEKPAPLSMEDLSESEHSNIFRRMRDQEPTHAQPPEDSEEVFSTRRKRRRQPLLDTQETQEEVPKRLRKDGSSKQDAGQEKNAGRKMSAAAAAAVVTVSDAEEDAEPEAGSGEKKEDWEMEETEMPVIELEEEEDTEVYVPGQFRGAESQATGGVSIYQLETQPSDAGSPEDVSGPEENRDRESARHQSAQSLPGSSQPRELDATMEDGSPAKASQDGALASQHSKQMAGADKPPQSAPPADLSQTGASQAVAVALPEALTKSSQRPVAPPGQTLGAGAEQRVESMEIASSPRRATARLCSQGQGCGTESEEGGEGNRSKTAPVPHGSDQLQGRMEDPASQNPPLPTEGAQGAGEKRGPGEQPLERRTSDPFAFRASQSQETRLAAIPAQTPTVGSAARKAKSGRSSRLARGGGTTQQSATKPRQTFPHTTPTSTKKRRGRGRGRSLGSSMHSKASSSSGGELAMQPPQPRRSIIPRFTLLQQRASQQPDRAQEAVSTSSAAVGQAASVSAAGPPRPTHSVRSPVKAVHFQMDAVQPTAPQSPAKSQMSTQAIFPDTQPPPPPAPPTQPPPTQPPPTGASQVTYGPSSGSSQSSDRVLEEVVVQEVIKRVVYRTVTRKLSLIKDGTVISMNTREEQDEPVILSMKTTHEKNYLSPLPSPSRSASTLTSGDLGDVSSLSSRTYSSESKGSTLSSLETVAPSQTSASAPMAAMASSTRRLSEVAAMESAQHDSNPPGQVGKAASGRLSGSSLEGPALTTPDQSTIDRVDSHLGQAVSSGHTSNTSDLFPSPDDGRQGPTSKDAGSKVAKATSHSPLRREAADSSQEIPSNQQGQLSHGAGTTARSALSPETSAFPRAGASNGNHGDELSITEPAAAVSRSRGSRSSDELFPLHRTSSGSDIPCSQVPRPRPSSGSDIPAAQGQRQRSSSVSEEQMSPMSVAGSTGSRGFPVRDLGDQSDSQKTSGKRGREEDMAGSSGHKRRRRLIMEDVGEKKETDESDGDEISPIIPVMQPVSAGEVTEGQPRIPYASKAEMGAPVMAKWKDGFYYPGVIVGIDPNKFLIKFDDGDKRAVKAAEVILVRCLPLGQSVMVMSSDGFFDPALIVSHVDTQQNVVYNIEKDDGTVERCEGSSIILSEDQAKCLMSDEDLRATTSTVSTSTAHFADVSLDNLVDHKRKRSEPTTPKAEPPSTETSRRSRRGRGGEGGLHATSTPIPRGKTCTSKATRATHRQQSAVKEAPQTTPKKPASTPSTSGAGDVGTASAPKPKPAPGSHLPGTDVVGSAVSSPSVTRRSPRKSGPVPPESCPMPFKNNLFRGMIFLITYVVKTSELRRQEKRLLADSSLETDDSGTDGEEALATLDKEALRQQLEAGGGQVLDSYDPVKIDAAYRCYLISNTYHRTVKYMQCLAAGIPCLSFLWVNECCRLGKILDHKAYILPAGISLEKRKLIEWAPRGNPLTGLRVLVTSDKPSFNEAWKKVLTIAKCDICSRFPPSKDPEGLDVVISDRSCPSGIVRQARQQKIPLLSTEWIVQCLINGKQLAFDGHRRYSYDAEQMVA